MRARPLALALVLALALALALALPTAAARVTVDSIEVPPRTAALKPFDVNVTLRNDGPARTVYLFGALYDVEPGRTCGPSTDPRFRTFTHMVQEAVELPAASVTRHPAQGERWLHRYSTSDATVEPEDAQLCIFVANASAGPLIDYETFAPTLLSVRAVNGAPTVAFSWRPERPAASMEATFIAQATDAEGDPLEIRWDFGHFDAAGRAVDKGERVAHAFYPAGTYTVTLTASDGIDERQVSRVVEVASAAADDAREEPRLVPAPVLLTLVALLAAAGALPPWRRARSR